GSWAPENWATSQECPSSGDRPTNPAKTSFSCLTGQVDFLPSAQQILKGVAGIPGNSLYFTASWDGVTPQACQPPDQHGLPSIYNVQCWAPPSQGGQGLTSGNCCPTPSGSMLACCDQTNFIIDNTTRRFSTTTKSYRYGNATFD